MAKKRGYARVSTKGQALTGNSLEEQRSKLEEYGCDEIVEEAYTGTTMERPKFTKLVGSLEPGDTLVVTKLDRFARTAGEGSIMVKQLIERGIRVHILNFGLIENTPNGILMMNILFAFAEFERAMIVERTGEGKARARSQDPEWREGRKALEIPDEYYDYREDVAAGGITVKAACAELGISRSTWYKWNRMEAVVNG